MSHRASTSKLGRTDNRQWDRQDRDRPPRDAKPRHHGQSEDDEWQPKPGRDDQGGRREQYSAQGGNRYEREGYDKPRYAEKRDKEWKHYDKPANRPRETEDRWREPRPRIDQGRRHRDDSYGSRGRGYSKDREGQYGYRDDRNRHNYGNDDRNGARKPSDKPHYSRPEYDYYSQGNNSYSYKGSTHSKRKESGYERGWRNDDKSYDRNDREYDRYKESDYKSQRGYKRDFSRRRDSGDVDNYRFNNQPHQDTYRAPPYDYYKNSKDSQQGYSMENKEDNYKFRKPQGANHRDQRPKKPFNPSDDPWMEEDSEESDEYEHHHPSRKSSGVGNAPYKKPYSNAGGHRDRNGYQQGVQRDWHRRVDNYGYIERKTHLKTGDSKTEGTVHRGKAYYVKVDGDGKEESKGNHDDRDQRESSSEYRVKQ